MDPPLRRTQKAVPSVLGAGHWPARGRGTPQGGFSRPSADSPSAPLLRFSKNLPELGGGGPRASRRSIWAGRPGVPPLRWEPKSDSASGTGDREGRPYGFMKVYLNPWRAGLGPAPTADAEAVLSFRRGRTLAGPQIYAARPGGRALRLSTSRHLLGKARRRCGIAPASIFGKPGPGGPE